MEGPIKAKLNHFIAEYSEAISSTGIDIPKDSKLLKVFVRKFLKLTKKNMPDDRVKGMITYPLEEIVLIAFLAVLEGAASWAEIESFGESKLSWLRKFIKLENGIPSHDTFRRVFGLAHRNELQAMTVEFLLSNVEGIKHALKVRSLQTLHVYDTATGICLYSQPIEEKTNEIPTAQGILSAMDLKNTVVSFDAMNTQKETAAVIRRQGEHWSVEQFHRHLDTVFEEDDNTTLDPTAFNNKSLLNKMALSLMKLARPLFKKGTRIRIIQKNYGWNYEENLAKLLVSLDEDTLRAALESAIV